MKKSWRTTLLGVLAIGLAIYGVTDNLRCNRTNWRYYKSEAAFVIIGAALMCAKDHKVTGVHP